MNENICLANFGDKLKVNGKVDLQYVMEDGSVIHNEAKNTAFTSTWAASGLVKCLLSGSDSERLVLELTDCDDAPDMNFPFLNGTTVGFAYLNSSSSGKYRGSEIANKRIISFENGKLVASFTYEWTASQIPGTIRSIGYTLQNKSSDLSSAGGYNFLTIPVITKQCKAFYQTMYDSYDKVYDYRKQFSYAYAYYSNGGSDDTGSYFSFTVYRMYNSIGAPSYSSKAIKFYYTVGYTADRNIVYDHHLYYDVDTGNVGIVIDYIVRTSSTADFETHRALFLIDFENGTSSASWDVILDTAHTITYYSELYRYFNPFRVTENSGINDYKVLIKKGNKLYLKISMSSSSSLLTLLDNYPQMSSTFCYTDLGKVQANTTPNDFYFPKRYKTLLIGTSGDYLYDANYCLSKYSSPKVSGFAINSAGDVCYVCDSESVLRSDNSYGNTPISVCIDADTDQLIATRMMLSNSGSNYSIIANDGAIEHIVLKDQHIYYVPIFPYVGSSVGSTDVKEKFCADAQMFQALTHFHVPAEAQVRPENSGVRIVYELTISNPT